MWKINKNGYNYKVISMCIVLFEYIENVGMKIANFRFSIELSNDWLPWFLPFDIWLMCD